MTDWRQIGSRLLGASPALKKALGLKDGLAPSEAVRRVVDQAPELGEFVDLDEIDEDVSRWKTLRTDQGKSKQLSSTAATANAKYRAAEFASSPGVQAISLPFRLGGSLGWEETPGMVAKELAGGGTKGALVGGVTDALVDPINAATMVATGGGSIGAKELLTKVGGLSLVEQAESLRQVAKEHGVRSPAFKEGVAASVGGLAAGMGLPAAVGAARARIRPRVPVGAGAPPAGTPAAPPAPPPAQRIPVGKPAPPAIPAPAPQTGTATPAVARETTPPQAPAGATGPPSRAAKADDSVARAEVRLRAAQSALDYQKSQRLAPGNEEYLVQQAKVKLEAAKVHAQRVREFEGMSDDDKSWVETVIGAQESLGATKTYRGDDIGKVFSKEASTSAKHEMGLEGSGKRTISTGGRRPFEEGFDKVAEAMELPEATTYAEQVHRDQVVLDAVEAARTGKQVLTPRAIDEGAGGINYREMAASQGWDIDDLVKLHKRVQAGQELTPPQLERYVKAVKAARGLDIGRGPGESYTYEDHRSRRALGKAAQDDVENLDAEPDSLDVDTSFDPATFAGNAQMKKGRTKPALYLMEENQIRLMAEDGMSPESIAERMNAFQAGDNPLSVADVRSVLGEPSLAGNAQMKKGRTPPPQAPVPPDAPAGPKETAVDLSAPPSWSVERPPQPNAGVLGKLADAFRANFRTIHSELVTKGLKNVATVVDRIGFHTDDWSVKARAKFDQIKALGITDADLSRIHDTAMTGGKVEGKDAQAYKLIREIFDSQYARASERDPTRGVEGESLTGVAPPEGPYWPRTFDGEIAPPPITANEPFRGLDQTGVAKAPSLYKERMESGGSVPVLTLEGLEDIAHSRARSVGALQGAASKTRTPDAYPAVFKAIYADERRKSPGPDGQADAEAAARIRLDELQLPDLYEAAARDMPEATWTKLVNDETVSRAADEVVKGRSAMTDDAKNISSKAKMVTRTAQLGFAAPLNYYGLSYVPGMAYRAARDSGSGVVGAAAQAVKSGAKAIGHAAVNTATDVGMAAGRAIGATDKLSPSQAAFGRSRAGANLPMRAIAMTDRNARLAVAQALRDVIPTMKHEQFRYTDRNLPMTHPRNISIAQKEIANATQGLGTLADKLKATGNPAVDIARELAAQYMSPELRQAEKMVPRLGAGGVVAGLAGAAIIGEGVQDMRAGMRGGGLNLPGAETTEDQEEKPLRSVIATDRDPRLLARVAQNVVGGMPFGKQAIQSYEYGDVPMMGAAPSLALANEVKKAVQLSYKTGDLRALLSIVNAPGFGRDWAKIVKYEEARAKNPKNGLGGVPQNLTLPWKIQAYLDGTMTAEQVLQDSLGQGGPTLPMERKAVQHREEANRKKKKQAEKDSRK